MRRSYVDEFWKRFFWGSRNHDSLIVERLWNDPGVGQSKNSSGLLITRIFNPCGVAGFSNAVALITWLAAFRRQSQSAGDDSALL